MVDFCGSSATSYEGLAHTYQQYGGLLYANGIVSAIAGMGGGSYYNTTCHRQFFFCRFWSAYNAGVLLCKRRIGFKMCRRPVEKLQKAKETGLVIGRARKYPRAPKPRKSVCVRIIIQHLLIKCPHGWEIGMKITRPCKHTEPGRIVRAVDMLLLFRGKWKCGRTENNAALTQRSSQKKICKKI
jgi:hypothetical protein